MTFPEFVDNAAAHFKTVGGRIDERRENPAHSLWWVTFSRAGCLYRVRFDGREQVLILEREQGSFVPNSPSTWRFLEKRDVAEGDFVLALAAMKDLLLRFQPARS